MVGASFFLANLAHTNARAHWSGSIACCLMIIVIRITIIIIRALNLIMGGRAEPSRAAGKPKLGRCFREGGCSRRLLALLLLCCLCVWLGGGETRARARPYPRRPAIRGSYRLRPTDKSYITTP